MASPATVAPSGRRLSRRLHVNADPQDQQAGPSRDRNLISRPLTLPPYEPSIAPLNPEARIALAALPRSPILRHLKTHIEHVSGGLTDCAGEINDRLTDAKSRYEKQSQKRRELRNKTADGDEDREDNDDNYNDNNEDDEEEMRQVAKLEEDARRMTGRMEEKMRRVVDADVKADALMEILQQLGRPADEGGQAKGQKGARMNNRRTRTGRRPHGNDASDMSGEDEDVDMDHESLSDSNAEDEEILPPSKMLDAKLAEKSAQWDGLSLTERYTTNNAYIGFYRTVHESKHPGNEVPPLPHPSTWFNHIPEVVITSPNSDAPSGIPARIRNNRNTRGQNSRHPSADSDDLAIQGERISVKCPITLLPFKDPVTSTKCPHSFERSAIEDMLRRSRNQVTLTVPSGRKRVACVQCPVCTVNLTPSDLRSDAALLRRVRRAQQVAMAAMEDEEEDQDQEAQDEEESDSVMMGKGVAGSVARRKMRIKMERARTSSRDRSMVPNTQYETVESDDNDEEGGD